MRTLAACLAILALTITTSCDPEDGAGPDGGSGTEPPADASTGSSTDGAPPAVNPDQPDGEITGPLGDGGSGSGSGTPCTLPTGSGTTHAGTISADETWTAADSPHVVTSDVHIPEVTVTIEPCAVVRLRKGVIIDMGGGSAGQDGELIAHGEYDGTTRRPILFERDDEAEPWGSLRVFPSGMVDLEHVDLIGGGDHDTAVSSGGTLVAEGAGGNVGLTRNVRVVDVVIESSAGFGVNLRARAAFTDNSDSLIIRGSGNVAPPGNVDTRYPIYVAGAAFSTIPSGSLTGNARDEIFVAQTGTMHDPAVTFHERGIPYRLESHFGLWPEAGSQTGMSTLTIEAGVVIRFTSSPGSITSMTLGSLDLPVRLIARGTPQAPIVLTTAADAPAAGDWGGVEWFAGAATGNVMSNVKIEYAGGDSGNGSHGCGPGDNDAALFIGDWVPDEPFIEGCTFSDSAGGGIVFGWWSDPTGLETLLAVQNTFEDIGNGCEVSQHASATGGCPTPGVDDCYP
jgi:hypothetical protein